MCGRFNLISNAEALVEYFRITEMRLDPEMLRPRYNIAPGQTIAMVRDSDAGRELTPALWGLVPHWSREGRSQYSTINARAETVAEKPTYREPFRRRRCLIPATGFYEWKRDGEEKVPHHIRPAGEPLFAFAGLWDRWDREQPGFDSCTIIVTRASAAMQSIHERMPVILNPAQYNIWLNGGHYNRAQLESLLVPYAGAIESRAISKHVNNPRHDDARCLE